MTWGKVATVAVGVGSNIIASRASDKASKRAEKGAERSAAQVQAAADQARGDVFDFFPSAQKDLLAGAGAAGNLLTQGVTEQQRLLSAGNIGAQTTLGAGFGQQQNALLGLPVNQQAFAPRRIELSQPIQNPLIPQEGQPGLFSDVGQVKENIAREKTADISSNADVFRLIESGDIDIPGLDTNWLAKLEAAERADPDRNLLSLNSLLEAADQGNFDLFESGGFNAQNKATMRLLISGLAKIRGGA